MSCSARGMILISRANWFFLIIKVAKSWSLSNMTPEIQDRSSIFQQQQRCKATEPMSSTAKWNKSSLGFKDTCSNHPNKRSTLFLTMKLALILFDKEFWLEVDTLTCTVHFGNTSEITQHLSRWRRWVWWEEKNAKLHAQHSQLSQVSTSPDGLCPIVKLHAWPGLTGQLLLQQAWVGLSLGCLVLLGYLFFKQAPGWIV